MSSLSYFFPKESVTSNRILVFAQKFLGLQILQSDGRKFVAKGCFDVQKPILKIDHRFFTSLKLEVDLNNVDTNSKFFFEQP